VPRHTATIASKRLADRTHGILSDVFRAILAHSGSILGSSPFLDTCRLPQHEILDDEFAFTSGQRSAAGTARQLPINGLWPGFDFCDLIVTVAIRAIERWSLASSHECPNADSWLLALSYIPDRSLAIRRRQCVTRLSLKAIRL
jgi:hypothetical protein